MTVKSQNLKVAELGGTLFVQVPQRGCGLCARQFQILAAEARAAGHTRLVMDLSCTNVVESSLLGAWVDGIIAIGQPGSPETSGYITLLNANPSVRLSLETAGMEAWFEFKDEPVPCTSAFEPLNTPAEAMDKLEILKCCLQAHKTLMDINEKNVPKFKDVVEFMEQDLRRMETAKYS